MRTIKDLRSKLFQLQLLLRHTLLTSKQKQDVLNQIDTITIKLQSDIDLDYDLSNDTIEQRRKILHSNEGLRYHLHYHR